MRPESMIAPPRRSSDKAGFIPRTAAAEGAPANGAARANSPIATYWAGQAAAGPVEAFRRALAIHGRDPDRLTRDDQDFLSALDEFHVLGKEATSALAQLVDLKPGARVLDVGCGLGGPARRLVTDYGCEVFGLDITSEFLTIATHITNSFGLSGSIELVHADAAQFEFPKQEFDVVWMQVVAANIPQRDRLYANVYSALRPGGKFALYDNFQGSSSEIRFPVPWSVDGTTSTLLTEDATIAKCEQQGLKCIQGKHEQRALAWITEQYELNTREKALPPFGHNVILENFAEICASQKENLARDSVRFGYLVFEN